VGRASIRVVLAAAVLAAGALAVWSSSVLRRPQQIAPGSAAASNVLLITIDTLRADRVGAYGNTSGLTPALDRLAASGLRFDAAFTPVPLTLPAHASILTGREPFSHGVRNNTGFRLGDTATLATMLKSAGYRTAAFVGAFVLSARFGLNRGFDHYDDHYGHAGGRAGFRVAERRADRVIQPAIDWILGPPPVPGAAADQSDRGGAWFAWIHLYDPHAPYEAPPEYAYGRSPYDAEVAYTDAMIGRGLERLRADRRLDHTIIIVIGDHGESLGEHGEAAHGLFAYDATLRVPMIVSAPGVRPRVVRTPVATVDIVPTVLELLGIAAPSGLDGHSLLAAEGDATTSHRVLYFEALDANLTRGWARLVGVMVDHWKYIDLPIPELYDLQHDPHETQNLMAGEPERSRVLRARLKDLAERRNAAPGALRAAMDADARRRLASLGYVGSDEATKSTFTTADDPKSLVALNEAFYAALREQMQGRPEQALATLRDIIKKRPDFLDARMSAAAILGSTGRAGDAVALVEAAPGADRSATAQTELGLAFEAAGRLNEAAQCLERATRLRENDVETLSSLGIVYAQLRRFDEGRRLFRQILDTDPHAPEVWSNLGMLELGAGNRQSSAHAFRQAVAADAGYAAAWRGLGAALVAMDASGAVDAWRHALALNPADYDTLFNLGMVLSEAPQPADALPYLEQFVNRAPPDRYAPERARAATLIDRIGRKAGRRQP